MRGISFKGENCCARVIDRLGERCVGNVHWKGVDFDGNRPKLLHLSRGVQCVGAEGFVWLYP